MSVLNQSGEEQMECPLCMEPLEVDDLHFYPCTCGYQICRFCWNRIRETENGLCPACRKAYPENPADFTPLSQEQVAAIKTEKKAREAKRRNKTLESRRALANVRVVQNNLVFVVGLPVRLADPEILKRQEYFGKYGKIHKVVINQSTTYAGSQGPSASAYVTYVSPADALRAIQGVNNVTLDGRVLKGSLGTTKYCANFMKNQPCPKPDCMYLHELGDPKASFTKEEMHAGLHQVYERKLHNQLLASQRDQPPNNSSGNSSTNADTKSSSKDGNPSNFIPTTVVTSSHINVVNSTSSKSNKKESVNGSSSNGVGSGSGSSNGGGSSGSSSSGKEAWPSLGSSPPAHSPARAPPSPGPHHAHVKSQENGTSESSSPTQSQSQPQPAPTKNKEHDSNKNKNKATDNATNGQSKKSKTDKAKQKSNSTSGHSEATGNNTSHAHNIDTKQAAQSNTTHSVFENDTTQQYLTNELDELESDRHSLLENHDLLDNSDHSLLDDDSTHNLLNDASNEALMMQRHREMLAGLVDSNISSNMMHMKPPMVNGYGLLDRDMGYLSDRQISQMGQGLMDQKDMLLRERSRSEMLMRQNEMLARQHNVMGDPKHYMPHSSIGLESASELLGANYHQNPNMLPPFGMRVDNSLASSTLGSMPGSSLGGSSLAGSSMAGNSLAGSSLAGNSLAGPSLAGSMPGSSMGGPSLAGSSLSAGALNAGYMMNHQMANHHQGMMNGFDAPQPNSEGRYLAENMDKFFTDFHKAQQMRLLLARGAGADERRAPHAAAAMLSAERLELHHKQRMNNGRAGSAGAGAGAQAQGGAGAGAGRAAGDGDDDLDFDPFKETQKALAEMMETEMMQNVVSSGDNMERVRRARLAPPGFAHHHPHHLRHHHHHQHQGYNTNSAMFADWTQMDPAIMSTSVSANRPPQQLSQQQQELFARFNQLNLQPSAIHKLQMPMQWGGAGGAGGAAGGAGGAGWGGLMPLPPGFAPAKPVRAPAECIDAK